MRQCSLLLGIDRLFAYRRSAGGVFLTLLKNNASTAEVKQVYARENASRKKRARMVEGNYKGKRKCKKKHKGKQDSKSPDTGQVGMEESKHRNVPDTGQEEMEESKHRKVPDRRQLISYADLADTHSSDVHAVGTSNEQSAMEGSSTVPGSVAVVGTVTAVGAVTAVDTVTAGSEGVSSEEARLAEDFDTKDTPDGLDGLEFDWY